MLHNHPRKLIRQTRAAEKCRSRKGTNLVRVELNSVGEAGMDCAALTKQQAKEIAR